MLCSNSLLEESQFRKFHSNYKPLNPKYPPFLPISDFVYLFVYLENPWSIERKREMSTDLLLKPSCSGCGSTTDLYGSNCKHMTLCLTCGKTMAEKKSKCYDCGATVTRLIRVGFLSLFPPSLSPLTLAMTELLIFQIA